MNTDALIEAILNVPLKQGRRLIAIVGAPASGKSTISEGLAERLENAVVLPMDGFHLENPELIDLGLLDRKGSPQTFDVAGLADIVSRLRTEDRVSYPTFDREGDCTVPGGGAVEPHHKTVLIEGNYLLLDEPGWRDLSRHWDFSVLLEVDVAVLRQRLIDRWLAHDHSQAQAIARAEYNDLPNAIVVQERSLKADIVLKSS